MIKAEFFKNQKGEISRFRIANHGKSVVCAAVSALSINAVNYMESRIQGQYRENHDETGFLDFEIMEIPDEENRKQAGILLDFLLFGLLEIKKIHEKEICVETREV